MRDAVERFRAAMINAGVNPPAALIADGQLHRFTIEGDKPKSDNGYYILFTDNIPAGQFGCWKRGISDNWSAREYHTLTNEEKNRYLTDMETAKAAREEELQRKQAECREKSAELWDKGESVDAAHPYILRKGIKPIGVKQLNDMLMIPILLDGAMTGLQFINAGGEKRFKSGSEITGAYLLIGESNETTILVSESYSTACSLNQATGHEVVIAFSAGNLLAVCKKLRAKYPDHRLIVCCDDDHDKELNTGLLKGTEAARSVNGLLAIPSFNDPAGKSDYNDMHLEQGLAAVQQSVLAAAPVIEAAAKSDVSAGIKALLQEKDTGGAWSEPLLFGEIETPEIPTAILPSWLGAYSQAVSDDTKTPSGLALMFALSTVATCLQKKFEVSPYQDRYCEPVNLWTVTALEPGNRKTAVKNAFTAPLTLWEQDQVEILAEKVKKAKHHRDINLKAIENLKLKAAKPDSDRKAVLKEISLIEEETPEEILYPRLWSDDTTPERLQSLLAEQKDRMALLSDEGGIFEIMSGLYSGGRANLNVFLQAHAGSDVRVERQGTQRHLAQTGAYLWACRPTGHNKQTGEWKLKLSGKRHPCPVPLLSAKKPCR